MTNRTSILHPMVEELKNASSSPLRRTSLIAQKIVPNEFADNDDEAERVSRRLAQNQPQASSSGAKSDKRRSLGLGFTAQLTQEQIYEQISQCVKLSAENKINMKNAFSFKMIDLMNYKASKWDSEKDSFQVASTSLDVSTKIYGFRVDSVYNDVLKMDTKQENNDGKKNHEENENHDVADENEAGETRATAKPKRKKSQKVLASADSLRGRIQTTNLASMVLNDIDSNRSDLLFLATLPHHASTGPYLHHYNDVIFDKVNQNVQPSINPVQCSRVERFDDISVCPSFANFEFLGWSADSEENENLDESHVQPSNDFQFNPDASLPLDDQDNGVGVDYDDLMDHDRTENVDRCQGPTNPRGTIINDGLREVIQNPSHREDSEYSYFQESLDIKWAGPLHWKIRDVLKNRHANLPIVEGCRKELRRKKELLLVYDEEAKNIAEQRFKQASGNRNKLQTKTVKNWTEDKITLLNDVDFDSLKFNKFFLRPKVFIKIIPRPEATRISEGANRFDLNNDSNDDYSHDTECIDNHSFNDNPPNVGDADMSQDVGFTQAFTDDNLVEAPKISSKIFIPFAQRAKKIDVKKLKRAIWKKLTSKDTESTDVQNCNESENVDKVQGVKSFKEIYKNLPKLLSEENAAELSVATTFMSLLHLANEKCLKIKKVEFPEDLIICQD